MNCGESHERQAPVYKVVSYGLVVGGVGDDGGGGGGGGGRKGG